MIYFDNAATTGKKPLAVIKTVTTALQEYSANPGRSGHNLSIKTATAVYNVREKVANFFGASGAENVVFTLNCTQSINLVLKGVLKRGDHVIVSSLEHNAVMRPLKKIGISFDVAKVSLEDDEKTLEAFKNAIKPNTKMIFCTAASNVCGKLLPLEAIGKLCLKRHLLFGVDAAQGAGVLPINMGRMNIDYLCVAPHKGLYAPMGIGILICQKDIENTIIEGGTGTNSLELFQPTILPEKFESGTVNVPAILGVGAGLEYVEKLGLDKIYTHEMMLIKNLYKSLSKMDEIRLYTPPPQKDLYAPVLAFNYGDYKSDYVAEYLSQNGVAVRGGYHCAPIAHKHLGTLENGAVRVSVATFNTAKEIESLVHLLNSKKIRKKL
ncbi:MAG: aminotransferase class V-fold PLP-dependent enzyme [Ruminococcaceae bacterium]|nr:aminotransferase class V-fold PLP-dependent enzyme [Oscillospiraceae bacterium]